MEQIIECNNLTHYYGKRLIYENLSFTVPKGRILDYWERTVRERHYQYSKWLSETRSGECRDLDRTFKQWILLWDGISDYWSKAMQYRFMTITQIEKFYAAFYPGQWRKDAYYELMDKLKVAPGQRIAVCLAVATLTEWHWDWFLRKIDLLVLDDFRSGFPGYRRLFTDYPWLCTVKNKTVFLTSHIIQDMERLIDDCIIMDMGKYWYNRR